MTNNISTRPRLDILEGLGLHLITGELNHKKWVFLDLTDSRTIPNEKFGDSVSELPFLFPDEFEFWSYYSSRKVLFNRFQVSQRTASFLFGFDRENDPKLLFQNLGEILFNPSFYKEDFGKHPSPQKVGKQILKFVKDYRIRYPQKNE